MFLRRILITALLLLNLAPLVSHADWINLTGAETSPNIAEIYVMDDHVRIVLEVYVGDIDTFESLVPDDWLKQDDGERPSRSERMRNFSEKVLKVLTPDGVPLQASLVRVEPRSRVDRRSPFAGMINPYTRQRVPEAPADKRVMYVELVYPFSGQPESLVFVPPLDTEGRPIVTLGFIAYHKAVPIIDFRYLGAAATVRLDWDDPWYTKFDNPNLKRHHKSAMMSFLYVEDYEVRHEVLTRVKDMANWMDLGLRGDEYIEADELDGLMQRIGEFLLTRNTLHIDGQPVKPILDRSSYVKVGLSGIQLIEQPQRLEISTAIIGVIMAYLTDEIPQQVTVDWDLFSEQIQRVPATASDPAGPLPTFLTPEDNVHTWTNYLKNYVPATVVDVSLADTVNKLQVPLISLLAIAALIPILVIWRRRSRSGSSLWPVYSAAGLAIVLAVVMYPRMKIEFERPVSMLTGLDDTEARLVVASLLDNVYRAFDFREEANVYDKLAISVEGDLLTDIYLQNRKSFAIKQAGGAQARVKDVEVLSARARPMVDNAFAVDANWTAQGSVGHWGHVHTRKNYYDAVITIAPVNGNWKITGLDLVEEKRIEPGAPVPAGTSQGS